VLEVRFGLLICISKAVFIGCTFCSAGLGKEGIGVV
jgi:hypothetical protein